MIQRQYRVGIGIALITMGMVIAIAGWVGVSGETEVAFQLPYFASAGVAALMLLGFGSVLLLGVQLDRDTERIEDLERAVTQLADEIGRLTDELTAQRPEPVSNGGKRPRAPARR